MELLGLIRQSPVAFGLFVGVIGLLVGSFLNVVIHRLPIMLMRRWRHDCQEFMEGTSPATEDNEKLNLAVPRSRCPHCGHTIRAIENIPVLSWLWLKGKCAHCRQPISPRYPAIEILAAMLGAFTAWHFGFGLAGIAAIILVWALIALSFVDIDHHLLPDIIVLPLLWLGLLLNIPGTFVPLPAAVIGAATGYLSLWLVFHLFRMITGKEGMGYGDFKLLAMLGAWLGWQYLLLIVLLSSFVGAVVGMALILFRGHDRAQPLPFGPYLAAAGWIALVWGGDILARYLQIAQL